MADTWPDGVGRIVLDEVDSTNRVPTAAGLDVANPATGALLGRAAASGPAETDAAVQAALSNTVWLQSDVTANDAEDKALLDRFGVFGPPTIIFFGTDGQQRHGYEVVGYMKAEAFAGHVQKAFAAPAVTASN